MDHRLPLLSPAPPRGQRTALLMASRGRLAQIGLVALVTLLGVGALMWAAADGHVHRSPARAGMAGAARAGDRQGPPGGRPGTRAVSPTRAATSEVPDPQAALSAPAPASVHHAAAVAPSYAAVAAGAPSDAEIRRELRMMSAAARADRRAASGQALRRIAPDGTVTPRAGIPLVIAQVIAGANAITNFPYVFGGGHGSFIDNAYDCSGSVSYALAAGGLLASPQTSGTLESWGAPGPGRWLTIYANAGHVYMFVDGLRYDTSGRTGVFSTRWQTGPDPGAGPTNAGFTARHYPGL